MPENNPAGRRPHNPGGLHKHPFPDVKGLCPGSAQIDRNAGYGQNDNQIEHRAFQHEQYDHGQQQRRERHDDIGKAHDHLAQGPGRVARDQPQSGANGQREEDRAGRHKDRILRSYDDPGKQGTPKRITAQPEKPVRRKIEGRFCFVATSSSNNGPKMAQKRMSARNITETHANLSRQSIARVCITGLGASGISGAPSF